MPNQSSLVPAFLTFIDLFMRRSMQGLVRFAREHNLSMTQVATLYQLSHRGGMAVSDIGSRLGVSNAAASQMLDKLVQNGLVTRAENPEDRREKQLVLTEAGKDVLAETASFRQAWLGRLAASLSPEEQAQVAQAFKILVDQMSQLSDE